MWRVLISFCLIFLAVPSFAYVAGKNTVQQKLIYCPQEITCTRKGDYSSCKYVSESSQYWGGGYDAGGVGAVVSKGTYNLNLVRSNFHNNVMYTDCMYIIKNPSPDVPVNASLYLLVKRGVFLEANYSRGSLWIDDGMNGIRCMSDKSSSCPLSVPSGLGVVYDKIDLKKYKVNSSVPPIWIDGKRVFLPYDKATNCWSSKVCKIDFDISSNDTGKVAIGSVIVDMNNNMKILEINSIVSSGMVIKKMNGLNTVEIKKAEDPSASPSVEISNLTGLDLELYSEKTLSGKVSARSKGSLLKSRMSPDCQNMAGCLVYVKTIDGGLIGSIMIDAENDMTVFSARATRPSAIEIYVHDSHRIEIAYPEKK